MKTFPHTLPRIAHAAAETRARHEEFRARLRALMLPASDIETLSSAILRQSQMLGSSGVMDAHKIHQYLASRALHWLVLEAASVQKIIAQLPGSTRDLGIMVLAENVHPTTGKRLDPEELKSIKPQLRLQ